MAPEAGRVTQRPWGQVESLGSGEHHRVRRLSIAPGAILPLERHPEQSEHWIVVKGLARVARGVHTFTLSENESVHIPAGTWRGIANPSQSAPLDLVEVQIDAVTAGDQVVDLGDARRSA